MLPSDGQRSGELFTPFEKLDLVLASPEHISAHPVQRSSIPFPKRYPIHPSIMHASRTHYFGVTSSTLVSSSSTPFLPTVMKRIETESEKKNMSMRRRI